MDHESLAEFHRKESEVSMGAMGIDPLSGLGIDSDRSTSASAGETTSASAGETTSASTGETTSASAGETTSASTDETASASTDETASASADKTASASTGETANKSTCADHDSKAQHLEADDPQTDHSESGDSSPRSCERGDSVLTSTGCDSSFESGGPEYFSNDQRLQTREGAVLSSHAETSCSCAATKSREKRFFGRERLFDRDSYPRYDASLGTEGNFGTLKIGSFGPSK